MAKERFLRLRRLDAGDEDFVLLHVKPNGKEPLDLILTGTDGESPFETFLTSQKASKLKAKSSIQDDATWSACLSYLLLDQRPAETAQHKYLQGIELLASVKSEDTLTISLRQDISGITHTLGSILLPYSPETEVGLFYWAAASASRCNELSQQLEVADLKMSSQAHAVQRMQEQLDDLIKAKKQHEDEILEKCRQLLNSKKLKIRDQQRLLATAKLSSSVAKDVRAARKQNGLTSSKAPVQRAGKRKADGEVKGATASEDEDIAPEAMTDDETDIEGLQTPDFDHKSEADSDAGAFGDVKQEPLSQHKSSPVQQPSSAVPREEQSIPATMSVDEEETDDEL